MSATIVRPARITDAPAIAELAHAVHAMHAGALPDVFQPSDAPVLAVVAVERLVARAGPLFLVATVDEAFAGYARAELQDEPASAHKRAARTLYLAEMGVAPEWRKRGVGRALLAAVRDAAAERGAAAIALDVYAFNAEARAFYEREGFASLRERMIAPVARARA